MQNAAFRRENVNAILLPLKVHTLTDLLTLVRELPLAGVAVTMPLKQEMLPHLANMDPLTGRIGACNTLRTGADGKLYGFNTDVAGVVRPLEKRLRLKGARIAVLGAGGAARAAVFGLVEQGAEVFIVNRTHENGRGAGHGGQGQVAEARAACQEPLRRAHQLDARAAWPATKQALPIEENELNAGLVFDMVYNPLETPLLKLAKARGIPVISGLEMFVQQGARQFEIWTGKPAPEAEMMRVVELELNGGGEKCFIRFMFTLATRSMRTESSFPIFRGAFPPQTTGSRLTGWRRRPWNAIWRVRRCPSPRQPLWKNWPPTRATRAAYGCWSTSI